MKKSVKKKIPKIIFLTPGDRDGVGPEVAAKALIPGGFLNLAQKKNCQVIWVGAFPKEKKYASLRKKIMVQEPPAFLKIKSPAARVGKECGWAIEWATKNILAAPRGSAALVTGAINKERLRLGGYPFVGHTDFLQSLAGVARVTMSLMNPKLRVALVTTHLPLRGVAPALTGENIVGTLARFSNGLRSVTAVRRPRLAVLGLNPHAGENGVLGDEEKNLIIPAIRTFNQKHKNLGQAFGPFPSDTFFPVHAKDYDGVVAMYHDQGLIPVKLLDFWGTINVTFGLPFFRSSVDHGTAYDIAKKNIANPKSMGAALRMALISLTADFLEESL